MKIKAIAIISLILTGCADMQATRLPENKIQLNINQSYQSAYRRILQSTLNECNYLPDTVKNASFEDNNSANITSTEHGVVGWTMDIMKATETTSIVHFYTAYSAQKKYAYRVENALNKGFKGCIFDAPI